MKAQLWVSVSEWAAAALVAVWRLSSRPPGQAWRDVVLLLPLIWVVERRVLRPDLKLPIRVVAMAYLTGVYLHCQMPFTMSLWRS